MTHTRNRTRSLRSLFSFTGPSKTEETSHPRAPSPTFSDISHVSASIFGQNAPAKIITRAHLKKSMDAYEELMDTTKAYRSALSTLAKATSAFADALEACAGLKGPSYEAGTRIQAASGLHHLMGNHWHFLSETLDKSLEKPLRQHLETYRSIVEERSASYEKALRDRSHAIREIEMRNINRRDRNLQSFRENLNLLQREVEELDELKQSHYQEIVEHEEEVWEVVQSKISVEVRSTMEVLEKFTAKSSDPVIEGMLQSVPDPFDSYGSSQSEDQIFSILAPLSIMSSAPSPAPSPSVASSVNDFHSTVRASTSRHNSWTAGLEGGFFGQVPSTEWADAQSPAVSPTAVQFPSLSPSSTPPASRSISPPPKANMNHRSSTSPVRHHQSKKSESKMKNVLTVIDESHRRQPEIIQVHKASEDSPKPGTAVNGWLASTMPNHYAEGEPTPRNSRTFAEQQQGGTESGDTDVKSEHSGDTVHVPVAA